MSRREIGVQLGGRKIDGTMAALLVIALFMIWVAFQ